MDEPDSVVEAPEKEWPSIDDATPDDDGGTVARNGFNYQDEIAVSLLIEMLDDPEIVETNCETHDDIIVVRVTSGSSSRIVEYVQVKGSEKDQLWSVATLCKSTNGNAGSSLYETSLSKDQHKEAARFRIATLRPVNQALRPLTYPPNAPGRSISDQHMVDLKAEIDKKFPDLRSPKGATSGYWLENCRWHECHDEQTVHGQNWLAVLKLASGEGYRLLPDQAEIILLELLAKAKAAGAAKWKVDPSAKKITRMALRQWWKDRVAEALSGASSASGTKLQEKMTAAGLPDDAIKMAVALRRMYAAAVRTDKYLEPDEAAMLTRQAQAELAMLQARHIADDAPASGKKFHALCAERMHEIAKNGPPGKHSSFLLGCLYDVADRCLLRFERPAP